MMPYPNILKTCTTLAFLCIVTIQYGQSDYYFPAKGERWKEAKAVDYDIDQNKLNEAVQFAEDNEYSESRDLRLAILKGFSHEPFHKLLGPVKHRGGPAGMILKNGYIIAQWGDTKRVDMTFSVTKSYLSTLAGLAVQKNMIRSVDDKVGEYVWDGHFDGAHNSKINWSHLLTQSSDWTGQLWGGYDWADRPEKEGGLDDWKMRKLNEPGSVFEYNDVRVNLLAYSLLQVWRKPLPQVLKEEIMDPIGASSTWRWFGYDNSWVNVDGLEMQSVSGGGHSGGGIFINTEDHARFGLLFLNNGKWVDKQILDSKWITASTLPSLANPSYGFMWWLNTKGESRSVDGFSETLFYAAGFGGNYIIVDKENDLLIVTRWLEPKKRKEFLNLLAQAFSKE